jgi:hypothetical protein
VCSETGKIQAELFEDKAFGEEVAKLRYGGSTAFAHFGQNGAFACGAGITPTDWWREDDNFRKQ